MRKHPGPVRNRRFDRNTTCFLFRGRRSNISRKHFFMTKSTRMGRPPKTEAEKHSNIKITLPPTTMAKLNEMVRPGDSRSSTIARLIEAAE